MYQSTLLKTVCLLWIISTTNASVGTAYVVYFTGNNVSLNLDQSAYTQRGSKVTMECSHNGRESHNSLEITDDKGVVLERSRSENVSLLIGPVTCSHMGVYTCRTRPRDSTEQIIQTLSLGVDDCPPKLCSNEESIRTITSDVGSHARISVRIITTVTSPHYPVVSVDGVMINGTDQSSKFDFTWEQAPASSIHYDLTITMRSIAVDDFGYWNFKIYSSEKRYVRYQVLVKPRGNPHDVQLITKLFNNSRFCHVECEVEGYPRSMAIVINSKLVKTIRNRNNQHALRLWDIFYLQNGVGSLVCLVTDFKGENLTRTNDVLYFKDTDPAMTSQHNVSIEDAHLHLCKNETNERKYYVTLGAKFQISVCVTTGQVIQNFLDTSLTMYSNGRHLSTASGDLRVEKREGHTYAITFTIHRVREKDLTNYVLLHRLDHPFEQYVHTFILEQYTGPPILCPGESSQRTVTAEIGTTASLLLCVLSFPELGDTFKINNKTYALNGPANDDKITVRYYEPSLSDNRYVEIEIHDIEEQDLKTYQIYVESTSKQALMYRFHLKGKTATTHEQLRFTINDFQPHSFLGHVLMRAKKHSSITLKCQVENSNGSYSIEIRNTSSDDNITFLVADGGASAASYTLHNISCEDSGIFECRAHGRIKRFSLVIALNVLGCSPIKEIKIMPFFEASPVKICPSESFNTHKEVTATRKTTETISEKATLRTTKIIAQTEATLKTPNSQAHMEATMKTPEMEHKEISSSRDEITIAVTIGFVIGSFLTLSIIFVCFKVLQYRKRHLKYSNNGMFAVQWRQSSDHVYDKIVLQSNTQQICLEEN